MAGQAAEPQALGAITRTQRLATLDSTGREALKPAGRYGHRPGRPCYPYRSAPATRLESKCPAKARQAAWGRALPNVGAKGKHQDGPASAQPLLPRPGTAHPSWSRSEYGAPGPSPAASCRVRPPWGFQAPPPGPGHPEAVRGPATGPNRGNLSFPGCRRWPRPARPGPPRGCRP